MQRIAHVPGASLAEVRDALRDNGVAYLHSVQHEEELLTLTEQLGTVVAPGVGMPTGSHDGRVYAVAVRNSGRGTQDRHGHVILSTTAREFALHTDGYNLPRPPRYVLLLRTDTGVDDTISWISDARRAFALLSRSTLKQLERAIFPSAIGPLPVIGRDASAPQLRFNSEEMRRWRERAARGTASQRLADHVTDALHVALESVRESFTIRPGDCLILDNWRVCHGRAAMASDSTRVLKRTWAR